MHPLTYPLYPFRLCNCNSLHSYKVPESLVCCIWKWVKSRHTTQPSSLANMTMFSLKNSSTTQLGKSRSGYKITQFKSCVWELSRCPICDVTVVLVSLISKNHLLSLFFFLFRQNVNTFWHETTAIIYVMFKSFNMSDSEFATLTEIKQCTK